MPQFEELRQAIIDGKAPVSKELTEKMLKEGVRPGEFFPKAIIPAMDEVGRRMRECEFFIPEVLIAARAARASSDILRPLLVGAEAMTAAGTVVCGTVKGDLHDIGKNLVVSMLEGGGFEVIDVGADVPPEKFIAALKDTNARILALSALLTVTMPSMKTTIEALKAAGIREKVKVMIGGAPVTQEFADEIGADGYSENANSAVALARRLIGEV